MVDIFDLPEMTWPEAERAYREAKVAIIPVGAHEQHGPGIKLRVDGTQAYEIARLLARKVHPLAVVTPPVMLGVSFHHMGFPGTVSLRHETFMAVIEDIVDSLSRHGIKKFLIINSHGGNNAALGVVSSRIRVEKGIDVAYCLYADLARDVIDVPKDKLGHGSDPGLAVAIYLDETLVHLDRLEKGQEEYPLPMISSREPFKVSFPYYTHEVTANGAFGDPSTTRRELGERICQTATDRLAVFLRQFAETELKGL